MFVGFNRREKEVFCIYCCFFLKFSGCFLQQSVNKRKTNTSLGEKLYFLFHYIHPVMSILIHSSTLCPSKCGYCISSTRCVSLAFSVAVMQSSVPLYIVFLLTCNAYCSRLSCQIEIESLVCYFSTITCILHRFAGVVMAFPTKPERNPKYLQYKYIL